MFEKYIEYVIFIEDWNIYIYGLVLKIEYFYVLGKVKEVYELIVKIESFIFLLLILYDINIY